MALLAPIILAVVLGVWLLSVIFLWLPARWLRAANATFLRAAIIVSVLAVLGIVTGVASIPIAESAGRENSGFVSIAFLAVALVQVLITLVLIQRILGATPGRAVLIWLLHALMSGAASVGVVVLLKAFFMEAYLARTNAMAPTLLGYHYETKCPRCQGALVMSAPEPNDPFPRPMDHEQLGICLSCRKTNTQVAAGVVHPPDRFLVSKLHTPARWNLIVFRYPKEPENKYVMRLVGFPGETVYVKDGAVWINDAKMEVPPDLAGLEYTNEMEFERLVATPEDPLRLKADEYCVLGDFSKSSSDSRFWGPVPGANIEGVVCLRYWPPARWHVLR